jgi:hypothetical protein
MYIQPFFATRLALGAYGVLRMFWAAAPRVGGGRRRRGLRLVGIGAQQGYVEFSRSTPDATSLHVLTTADVLAAAAARGTRLGGAHRGRRSRGDRRAASPSTQNSPRPIWRKRRSPRSPTISSIAFAATARVRRRPTPTTRTRPALDVQEFRNREQLATLQLPPLRRSDGSPNRFRVPWMPAGKPQWLLEMGADASILNRSGDAEPGKTGRACGLARACATTSSRCRANSSARRLERRVGRRRAGGQARRCTVPNATPTASARSRAWGAIKPSKRSIRPVPCGLVFWASATLKSDGKNRVPHARVYGAKASRSQASAAARPDWSRKPSNRPRSTDCLAHRPGSRRRTACVFASTRPGLMNWFGTNIALDPRPLVVFGRDISLISDADYRSWTPPSWIVRPARGARRSALGYSGIYEDDGWVSDDAELTSRSDASTRRVRVEGLDPARRLGRLHHDGHPFGRRRLRFRSRNLGVGDLRPRSAARLERSGNTKSV